MSKTHNAGIVTAYGAAVRGGYTGTYEEFCAQQAQYAENARQMEQAVSDVRQIKTSVESAVSEAEGYANNANQSATNASNSATQASESASNANQSAERASQSADNASSSASSASQSAASAQTSATNASTSEQNARQSAKTAQDVLESVQAEGNTQINRVQSEGNTQIGRIQAKGNEVLDSLPDDFTEVQKELESLNGSLGDVKADLTYLLDEETSDDGISIASYSGATAILGTSGSASATGIMLSNSESYDSYYVPITETKEIYFASATSHNYIALCVGNAYTKTEAHSTYTSLKCTNGATRYRNSESNLPTANSKITVNAGDIIAITVPSNGDATIYGLDISTETILAPFLKAGIVDTVKAHKPLSVWGTSYQVFIQSQKMKIELRKITDANINVEVWRIYTGWIVADDGTTVGLWQSSDADGVIKVNGEDDFLGGIHGDEIMSAVHLLIDGVEQTLGTVFTAIDANTVDLYVESDIYHCNTSDSADRVCFKRSKHIQFKDNEYTVSNTYVAQEAVNLITAFLGMLSIDLQKNGTTLINGYSSNVNESFTLPTVQTASNPALESAKYLLPYGTVEINAYNMDRRSYVGSVNYYSSGTPRSKVYFNDINNMTSFASGDTLRGGYKLTFN